MNGFHRKALLFLSGFIHRTPPSRKIWFLIQYNPPAFTVKYSTNPPNRQSFTTSYLVDDCGFSPETAFSLSKYINLKSSEKPDSVLAILRNYGFSNSQILHVVKRVPMVLSYDPVKSLVPKFEFLRSKGVSSSELVEMVTVSPYVLNRSLENHVIPCFDVLKNLLRSDEEAISYIRKWPNLLSLSNLRTNIQVLLYNGIPELHVRKLFTLRPCLFYINCGTFREGVEKVKVLGFSPSHSRFLLALRAVNGMSKAKWASKIEIFKKWGWTEDVVLAAFRKYPNVMLISSSKIMAVMDFLVNQMGWDSLLLVRRPGILDMSFGGRIIPRTAVLHFLFSKGLIKKASLLTPITDSEELFLRRYVKCFKKEAPQLMKLYEEKLDMNK